MDNHANRLPRSEGDAFNLGEFGAVGDDNRALDQTPPRGCRDKGLVADCDVAGQVGFVVLGARPWKVGLTGMSEAPT